MSHKAKPSQGSYFLEIKIVVSKTNEDVIDVSVNTCCKLKLVFSEKRL